MTDVKLLYVITDRDAYEQYLEFFHDVGVNCVMSTFCEGTAPIKTLEYLGIAKSEKVLLQTFVYASDVEKIKYGLRNVTNLNAVGNGIAAFVSLDGIGGKGAKRFLIGEEDREGEKMEEKVQSKYVLIVTITNKGYNDEVMDAARSAGARGGTVVKAKGTGSEMTKFFGVSITEEKELVYIVALREDRENIMHAIMEKTGVKTDAHGVVFSLPVDEVEGFSL